MKYFDHSLPDQTFCEDKIVFNLDKMNKSMPKMSIMITSAIRYLRQNQGSTSKEIMDYIMSRYNLEPSMQRQIRAALKRGTNYDIFDKNGDNYKLKSMAEWDLARELADKSEKRRDRKWRVSAKNKTKKNKNKNKKKRKKVQRGQGGKGRSRGSTTTRSRAGGSGGRCRCIATRVKNAYTLKSDIPIKRQEQHQKDVETSEGTKPSWCSPVGFSRDALARIFQALTEGRGPGKGSLNKTNDHNSSSSGVKADSKLNDPSSKIYHLCDKNCWLKSNSRVIACQEIPVEKIDNLVYSRSVGSRMPSRIVESIAGVSCGKLWPAGSWVVPRPSGHHENKLKTQHSQLRVSSYTLRLPDDHRPPDS
ncbi:hypothetical protein M0804_011286 [Polistes exclamans]|nr:hypothetical protein M0804_011286 [Polistes exclamans]